MESNCIFCKILKGDLPSYTIYEDDTCKGILDIAPANRGHIILISKKHIANIYELTEEDAAKIMAAVIKVAKGVKESLKCDGLNILQNNGEIAGQTISHLHFHLIPRYLNDGITFSTEHKEFSSEELLAVAEEIKEKI